MQLSKNWLTFENRLKYLNPSLLWRDKISFLESISFPCAFSHLFFTITRPFPALTWLILALHGMGLGYLSNCLFLITSAHPIMAEKLCCGSHLLNQRVTSGGTQEEGLFFHGTHPLEHHFPIPGEIVTFSGILLEIHPNFAVSTVLGVLREWGSAEVAPLFVIANDLS